MGCEQEATDEKQAQLILWWLSYQTNSAIANKNF